MVNISTDVFEEGIVIGATEEHDRNAKKPNQVRVNAEVLVEPEPLEQVLHQTEDVEELFAADSFAEEIPDEVETLFEENRVLVFV